MNDQAKELRKRLDNYSQGNTAKTVSIVSGKGGVGKSNFAVNFSLELLKRKQKVLLIDLDVGMGNVDILLGLHAKQTIIDMIEKELPIHTIIEQGPNRLAYISGGSGITSFFSMDEHKQNFFYEQYHQLTAAYDYIIFDMGAGVTSDSIFFILSSDECIVITTPEPTSITDAYGMIKHIVNRQPDMPISVVMNRCPSIKIGEKALDRFQQVVTQFLQVEIKSLGMLPEDRIVSTSVMRQTPYVLMNDKSAVSKAIHKIAHNYVTNIKQIETSTPSSFLQKLKIFLGKR